MLTPFLMFDGKAEEAMNFYVSIFKNSKILEVSKYSKEDPGIEGTIHRASFSLDGQEFMCIDSTAKHNFDFTPSLSIHISCDSENEVERLYRELTEDGKVLMELGEYDFSKKYAWVADRFGVSWQINLV